MMVNRAKQQVIGIDVVAQVFRIVPRVHGLLQIGAF
jgi:hypothetical protein